jgi:predicted GTPase
MTILPVHSDLARHVMLLDRLAANLRSLAEIAEIRELKFEDDGDSPRLGLNITINNVREAIESAIQEAQAPFLIAVAGEFSRGKSTLLNALLGSSVLASDRRPNTAARTTLRYSAQTRLRVTYLDEERPPLEYTSEHLVEDLARVTSDAAVDPERYHQVLIGGEVSLAEQIASVDVWLPSKYLQERNFEIVDTPGLGSMFETHQIVTFNTLPHMDAVLFLTQFNTPIGDGEIVFLSSLKDHSDRFLFVINKVDLANDESNPEQALQKVLDLTRDALVYKARIIHPHIYPVAARRVLRGEAGSGLEDLIAALDSFIARGRGMERLRTLVRTTRMYQSWVSRDIQRQLALLRTNLVNCEAQLSQLDTKLQKDNEDIQQLLDLAYAQVKDIGKTFCNQTKELPEQIRTHVTDTLMQLAADALLNPTPHLRSTVQSAVEHWVHEQRQRFVQVAQVWVGQAELTLGILTEGTVRLAWTPPDVGISLHTTDLPLPQRITAQGLTAQVTALTGAIGYLRWRILRALEKPADGLTAYQYVVWGGDEQSVEFQYQQLISQWTHELIAACEQGTAHATQHVQRRYEENSAILREQQVMLHESIRRCQLQMRQVHDVHEVINEVVQVTRS